MLRVLFWLLGVVFCVCSLRLKLGGMRWTFSLVEVFSVQGDIRFYVDGVRLMFLRVVSLVTGRVLFFSSQYMGEEIFEYRFQGLIVAFVGSIMWLVVRGDLATVILGWDGLGVVSFVLVVFYQQPKAYGAGLVTALVNRVGDVFLICGISISLICGGGCLIQAVSWGLVLLAAITKSAQFPFSCWLPAAMAAPTPVSALVHSSTLVTAGVILSVRAEFGGSVLLLWLATVTAFGAGVRGVYENDGKKVIALSTLRQLGFIMVAVALNELVVGLAHLFIHAMFKSMLFICFGAVIIQNGHEQDLRRLGGLWDSSRRVSGAMQVSVRALCGLPFLRGYYSKDSILEVVVVASCRGLVVVGIFLSACLTGAYRVRIMWQVVWSGPRGRPVKISVRESRFLLSLLVVLGGSVVGGRFLWPASEVVGPYLVGTFKPFLGVLRFLGGACMVCVLSCGRLMIKMRRRYWGRMGYLRYMMGEGVAKIGLNVGLLAGK